MYKMICSAAIGLAGCLCGASDDGLLMRVNFDGYSAIPDKAVVREVKKDGLPPELQLRMFPGINGKGNAVCLNNPEHLSYPVENFSPDCGTVMIWFAPQNWSMIDSKHNQVFVEVRGAGYRFVLFKMKDRENCACFFLQTGKRHYAVIGTTANWKKGEWHHLTAVWNKREMKIYLDGKLSDVHQKRVFEPPMALPAKLEHCAIWVNPTQGWRHNPTWQTAYDELQIYNRCLSPEEISSVVEKYRPSNFDANIRRPKVTIPQGKTIVLDGIISEKEWQDASAVPVVNQMNYGRSSQECPLLPGMVRIKYDNQYLYVGFEIVHRPRKITVKGKDAPVWTNDSFDIFITGKDGKPRQFALNAGGGEYDALNENPKWNSGMKTAVKISDRGWSAELAIPLKDLGYPGKGDILSGNFGSTCFSPNVGYHTWARVTGFGKGFKSQEFFGKIAFGSPEDAVRLNGPGQVNNARFDLRLEGSRKLQGGMKWIARSGENATPSGNRINTRWEGTLPPGEVILSAGIKERSGKELLICDIFAEAKRPVTCDFLCLPSRKKLTFLLDFAAAGKSFAGCRGTAVLKGKKDGKIYAKKDFTVNAKELEIEFPYDGNLPGNSDFLLEADFAGKDLKVSKLFRTPDMSQFAAYKADHEVPPPWKKVEVRRNTVMVLDRSYHFDNGPLPTQIITRNDKVIGQQPNYVCNGVPVKWQTVRIGKNYGDYVEISGTGNAGEVKFDCKGELWFDGMYKFTVTLTPPAGNGKVESLFMKWQTPTVNARYLLATIFRPWTGDSIDLEWNTAELHSLMWTTGTLTGLAWWCESDANWRNPVGHKPIHLKRDGKITDVTIDMITVPGTPSRPFSYTMVLQGTPSRHPNTDWRNCNFGTTIPGSNTGIGPAGRGKSYPWDFRHYMSLVPENKKAFENIFNRWIEKKKIKLLCMAFPPHISRFDREYDVFFKEWATTPGIPWSSKDPETGESFFTLPCCGHGMAGNLFAGRIETLFKDHKNLGGIYYDISHVVRCNNVYHNHGGVDAFGEKFTSSNAMSMRYYFIQSYKLHKKYGRTIWLHAHNKFYPFVHDFADLWAPGEEQAPDIAKSPYYFYLEKIPMEEYQSAWNSEIRGVAVHMIPQEERVSGLMQELRPLRDKISNPVTLQHSIAPALLHDFKVWETAPRLKNKHPLGKVWTIKSKLKMEKAEFHGYWVSSAIRSKDPAIYGSWYSWKPGTAPLKRLLVIVNTSRKEKPAKLVIDWKQLGVDSSKVKMTELWTDRDLNIDSLQTLVIQPHCFALIGIK